MQDYRDLALADAAGDHVDLEAQLVSALAEAASYRSMFLLTLAAWRADRERLDRCGKCLRRCLGVDDDER